MEKAWEEAVIGRAHQSFTAINPGRKGTQTASTVKVKEIPCGAKMRGAACNLGSVRDRKKKL